MRMKLVDGWATPHEAIELYLDEREGDAHLLLVTDTAIEHVATFFHAGGVLRATVWHGTGADRAIGWREGQRRKTAATIAAIHAEPDFESAFEPHTGSDALPPGESETEPERATA